MKTSKIIFISLLSTITLLILAAAIVLCIAGKRIGNSSDDLKTIRQDIPNFKVLPVANSMNITLLQNDSSFVEVIFLKDSLPPKVNFATRGDTLLLNDFEKSVHRNVSVILHATDSLRMIRLNNSNLEVDRLGSQGVSFELGNSSLSLNQNTQLKVPCRSIAITAKNHSNINSADFEVDLLDLVLVNSEANLQLKAKKISGNLTDNSMLYARQPEVIALKKDPGSKVNVNDY